MLENGKVLNNLASKVTELMLKYELISVKAQNEAKSNQIMRLEEELKNQDLASDDLLKQVEAVLGR